MRISLVQSPRWSIFTPSYAVALLTGNLRSKGFTCFQKDFDVTFYNAVNAEQKELWHNDNAMFWNSAESVKQMVEPSGENAGLKCDQTPLAPLLTWRQFAGSAGAATQTR